jgi:hypothetical protein
MADTISLRGFMHAMASAVLEAQFQVERAQVENLTRFFDKNTRKPIYFDIQVPAMRSGATSEDHDTYRVPLIGLAPQSSIGIKSARVTFDVEVKGVEQSPIADPTLATLIPEPAKLLGIDINVAPPGGSSKDSPSLIHIVMSVENVSQPEGVARLLNEMTKFQAVHGASADTPDD